MARPAIQPIELDSADETIALQMTRWLSHLRAERRLSPKTLEAYARDLRQCLDFLCEHWGTRVTLARFSLLEASDVRAFMAMRRADDVSGRSLMRSLAGLRSFGRFLEREGKGKVGALSAIRAPKVGKTLPKPIQMAAAKRLADADERAGETRDPWIWARDAAVMALLYGSGLRISEALGLKRRDVPLPGAGDVLVVTGKGNKTRMVPVLQNVLTLVTDYVAVCPHHPTHHGAAARRAGITRQRDPACAQAFVRDPSSLPRRRPARDPGTARPFLALDHANLYRDRHRALARSLSFRASAKLIVAPLQNPDTFGRALCLLRERRGSVNRGLVNSEGNHERA
jgi:integrase/recombinase XerC